MRIAILLAAVFLALAPGGAQAQSRQQSLADIRQELVVLNAQIQSLKRELNTTGFGGTTGAGTEGTVLERVDSLEAELRRLTAQVEELMFRVERIVADGTNRIGDLEFRLVELEGGDVSQLGETSTLGGGDPGSTTVAIAPVTTDPGTEEMAVGEEADFQAAKEAFEAGDFEVAAEGFASFIETYPGGPLTAQAHFYRGESLSSMGVWNKAARAYLNAFSGEPGGPVAARSLLRLGVALDRIGQREEACLTLNEVPVRFPGSGEAVDAQAEMARLACS